MSIGDKLIISVSGVRGIVGETLTAEIVLRYAQAYGSSLKALIKDPSLRLLVGTDGRPSGVMLKNAVKAGVASEGCVPVDVGVVSTPTMGVAVAANGAAGGIQITASHNPAPYNGLKLFGPDGRVIPATEGEKIKERFLRGTQTQSRWDETPLEESYTQSVTQHTEKILASVSNEKIGKAGLRVLVDANGGAGGPLAATLLRSLNVEAVILGGSADGHFEHEPEPNAENLAHLGPQVAKNKVNAGFVLDPDADRLALFDEKGNFLGEELTLALAVWSRLGIQPGPVVINMSTSLVTEKMAERFSQPCFRSPVGEANVVDRMLKEKALIGGEGNGGVIDPRIGLVRDPFIGMALILELLAREGKPLSELASALPKFFIKKKKVQFALEHLTHWYSRVQEKFAGAVFDTADGLRLSWPDQWVHIRPSNTEPVVRIIAEATSEKVANQLCDVCIKLAGN